MNNITECGIWSWGHVIYDYRNFFRNMNKLGLNKITIWNDFAPTNAKEILNEAHKYGIKLIWGFAWGWDTDCIKTITELGNGGLKVIKESVIETFNNQYKDIAVDGIYFQSFTELDKSVVNGICVADAVVELVNDTAKELLSLYPWLNIEFGLHAMSVKDDLGKIAKTDKRIRIVWEDLGAFPFAYQPNEIDGFEQTLILTEKVLHLRGKDEKCGFIVKGMTKLDWNSFTHANGPLIIGESNKEYIEYRQIEMNKIWEELTKGWKDNIIYAQKTFELLKTSKNNISVQALIENGLFENEIKEPAVLFSQLCKE